MGMYELVEGKEVNGRGVWQMGKEWFLYNVMNKEWWISDRENMEAGKADGWVYVASIALTPDQVTETWKAYDGTRFVDASKVRAVQCPMAAARKVGDIRVEGQEQGDHQHDKMGMYELVEGKEVNGRGVWQMLGGKEWFVYYGRNNTSCTEWWISDRENMEAGKADGWVYVASIALTPDQIIGTWKVYEGTGFVDASKVRAVQCPMAAARKVGDIRVEGQEQGDHQHDKMGVYELVEGKEVNGRGVWQMAGGKEWFVYYGRNKEWWISDRENMEAGKADGWMYVASTTLTPDQVTKTWKAYEGTAWADAPKVKSRCV
jgi:hypothetical protein